MSAFRAILVAADYSESSRDAFRVACSLAHESKTRVFVLHVLEPQYVEQAPTYHNQQTLRLTVVERNPRDFEQERDRLRQFYVPERPLSMWYRSKEGMPSEVILREAEEIGCDLIVMGTHGRTGLKRLFAGSVAEAVLRRASCPVLALHAPESGDHPLREIHGILAPTDFSEPSLAAARVARGLARDLGARLVLLNVAPIESVIPGEFPMPVDLQWFRASLEKLRAELDGPDLKSPVETAFRQGNVTSEIRDAVEFLDCGLIVMGTHGRTGVSRLLMGSAAEDVLRRSNCPVLMVKSPEATGESTKGLVAMPVQGCV